MYWLDVCGPPGSGKSTLCDPLWGPHAIDFAGVKQFNPEWVPYLQVCQRLMDVLIKADHPATRAMDRMLWRSLRKIAVVEAIIPDRVEHVYIQTALAQRGLGFGWRLADIGKLELVRDYFRLMPVSLGVVFCDVPLDIVMIRNKAREQKAETAHENRSEMATKMQVVYPVMREVLRERSIPFFNLSTDQPVDVARRKLTETAAVLVRDAEASRSRRQASVLQGAA